MSRQKQSSRVIIREIVMCYESQYPDRLNNFEKLMGFPSEKYWNCRNKNLRKLSKYYDALIVDMDFLIRLVKKLGVKK